MALIVIPSLLSKRPWARIRARCEASFFIVLFWSYRGQYYTKKLLVWHLRCPTRDDSLAHHHSLLGDKRVRPQCILGTSRLFPSTGCPQARPHVPTHHRNRRRIAPFVRVP